MVTHLIVGLGNYPAQYQHTKHNVGFKVIDQFYQQLKLPSYQHRFDADISKFQSGDDQYIVAKPTTLMNLSGQSVIQIMQFYKIPPSNLLVVCDDVDTPIGSLRIRANGSSGGQKGIQNIIDMLGTNEFARIKIGIGRPNNAHMNLADYVLAPFEINDQPLISNVIIKVIEILTKWTKNISLTTLMNEYNKK